MQNIRLYQTIFYKAKQMLISQRSSRTESAEAAEAAARMCGINASATGRHGEKRSLELKVGEKSNPLISIS
jgi:hypothetical protein